MFGHRGLWQNGWKAVSYHPPGTAFEDDVWELYHLDRDFSETNDLAASEPKRLKRMIDSWWAEAKRNKVLPLDDRFGSRFTENAARFHGGRRDFVFSAGMGLVTAAVAPAVRRRTYAMLAHLEPGGLRTVGV